MWILLQETFQSQSLSAGVDIETSIINMRWAGFKSEVTLQTHFANFKQLLDQSASVGTPYTPAKSIVHLLRTLRDAKELNTALQIIRLTGNPITPTDTLTSAQAKYAAIQRTLLDAAQEIQSTTPAAPSLPPVAAFAASFDMSGVTCHGCHLKGLFKCDCPKHKFAPNPAGRGG